MGVGARNAISETAKGALKKKKKRVSGEFLACLETARLIAMRFRFETGSRQHLENDSLEELTKKLWFAPSQVYVFVPFTVSFVVLEGPPPLPRQPPPALPSLKAPGGSLTAPTPVCQPRVGADRGRPSCFWSWLGRGLKGFCCCRGKKFPEFSTGCCRKREPL